MMHRCRLKANLDAGFGELLTRALKPRKLGLAVGAPGPSVDQHNAIRPLEGLRDGRRQPRAHRKLEKPGRFASASSKDSIEMD
jgi:hypothetical protein